jgi:hypothetical protein
MTSTPHSDYSAYSAHCLFLLFTCFALCVCIVCCTPCSHLIPDSYSPLNGNLGNCSLLTIPVQNNSICTFSCNPGYYLLGIAARCVDNEWRSAELQRCLPCPPGHYQPHELYIGDHCLPCAPRAWTGLDIAAKNCTCEVGSRLLAGGLSNDYAGHYCVEKGYWAQSIHIQMYDNIDRKQYFAALIKGKAYMQIYRELYTILYNCIHICICTCIYI